jgi:hypothetical protein
MRELGYGPTRLLGYLPALQAPEGADALLCTALKCCLAADKGTRHGAVLGSFLADTLSPLPAVAPLLEVSLLLLLLLLLVVVKSLTATKMD